MSIIQDALKRKEEEERQGLRLRDEKKASDDSPPMPPPAQPEKTPEKPSDKEDGKPPWKAVILALLIVVLAFTAVYFLVVNGLRDFRDPAPAPMEHVQSDDTVETEDVEVVDPDPVAAELEQDEVEDRETEPESQDPDPETLETQPPAEPEVVADQDGIDDLTETDIPDDTAEEDAPAPDPVAEEEPVIVEWPRIHISGIMASRTGTEGSVLINSQLLAVGDSLQGVQIKSISERSVVLEYEGDVKTLNTGQTIGD